MSLILKNAILLDLDPPQVEPGNLRIAGGTIAERGTNLTADSGDELIDCGGAVVLPGFVNGHTHLYSALATGMPAPAAAPRNFREILEHIWWRLDRALDAESIELSARIGAIDALRCGTTTLIDHHASPSCIDGALDFIRRAMSSAGLRGVLCYETTDRHGRDGREAGLAENRRFLEACATRRDGMFAALVGAHASFTLDDDALDELAALAHECDAGIHIHVAEDLCDGEECAAHYQMLLLDRLAARGMLRAESIFAHCTHLDETAVEQVNAARTTVAHNPRSNMNNAVGYAPVAEFRGPVVLGTDGIGGDMLAEARAAWLISRHEQSGFSPGHVVGMLAAGARRASAALGVTLGRLEPGAAADVVITDYRPATPLESLNVAAHLLFGLDSRHVRHVLIGGQWRLRDRTVVGLDETAVRAAAMHATRGLWERMARLDG